MWPRKYTQLCRQPNSPSYKNSLLIFRVNLSGRTALVLLDRCKRGKYVISVFCMKNDVGNVVYDADGMKNIWRKYMEKHINVENDWDGEVDCPELM